MYGGDRNFESGSILLSNFDVMAKEVFDKTPQKRPMMFLIVNSFKTLPLLNVIGCEIRGTSRL
jgi:hypothetical protein